MGIILSYYFFVTSHSASRGVCWVRSHGLGCQGDHGTLAVTADVAY